MKKVSILDQFAQDAISAPQNVTGGFFWSIFKKKKTSSSSKKRRRDSHCRCTCY